MHMELPAELAVFKKDVGIWNATVEVRTKPGEPPLVSRGISRNRLDFGGRWLISDFENETGFGGHGVYGWDANKKKYVGVWVDSMRSSLAVMEGTYDAATRTMTMVGKIDKPDGGTFSWRETTETVDDETQVFRSFMPTPDGGEYEMLTVRYEREAG